MTNTNDSLRSSRHEQLIHRIGERFRVCFRHPLNHDLVELRLLEVPPARELWLLTRRDVQKTPRIRVVSDFLLDLVKRERSLFEGA